MWDYYGSWTGRQAVHIIVWIIAISAVIVAIIHALA